MVCLTFWRDEVRSGAFGPVANALANVLRAGGDLELSGVLQLALRLHAGKLGANPSSADAPFVLQSDTRYEGLFKLCEVCDCGFGRLAGAVECARTAWGDRGYQPARL